MQLDALTIIVKDALEDLKANDIVVMDVQGLSSVSDVMVVASGNSSRHVKSIANNVVEQVKKQGCRPIGVESDKDCEWVLVDLGDIIVHVMQQATRDFYQLERLWSTPAMSELGNQ